LISSIGRVIFNTEPPAPKNYCSNYHKTDPILHSIPDVNNN